MSNNNLEVSNEECVTGASCWNVRYVVIDENILGCTLARQPHWIQIISSSILRGAIVTWMDGVIAKPDKESGRMRPAELKDFEDFRVVKPSHYVLH